jgi:hypothetical protein
MFSCPTRCPLIPGLTMTAVEGGMELYSQTSQISALWLQGPGLCSTKPDGKNA